MQVVGQCRRCNRPVPLTVESLYNMATMDALEIDDMYETLLEEQHYPQCKGKN